MQNQNVTDILKSLIGFNTIHGHDDIPLCMEYIRGLLSGAGLHVRYVNLDGRHPNLIAEMEGKSHAEKLLFFGHIDVVPASDGDWAYPPFEAVEKNGYIHGRGALDMKSGVAMMIAAVLDLKRNNVVPGNDILLIFSSDEETGSENGFKYLTAVHGELFRDVRFAIGEFGGFPLHIGKKSFYAIQTSEKSFCYVRLTITGEGGHGAFAIHNRQMLILGKIARNLYYRIGTVRINKTTRDMFRILAGKSALPLKILFRLLVIPAFTKMLFTLFRKTLSPFEGLFFNTFNITYIEAGSRETVNVVPATIRLILDCRLLPDNTIEDLRKDLVRMTGVKNLQMDIMNYEGPTSENGERKFFRTLSGILLDLDGKAIPFPLILPASSDSRYLNRMGIHTYGFTPMNLPRDFHFLNGIHAANEKIPVESVEFGYKALTRLMVQGIP